MKLSRSDQQNIEEIYESMLQENMSSAAVLGGSGFEMGIANKDNYAEGDMRNPFGLGIVSRKGRVGKKNGKKRRK
jgi:hypothetical protein